MTKSVTLFLMVAILIVAVNLSSRSLAEAAPVHFPERYPKPVTSAPSVDDRDHWKCPRGYRVVHGNCRKVYG
jgi:hypothetical protein